MIIDVDSFGPTEERCYRIVDEEDLGDAVASIERRMATVAQPPAGLARFSASSSALCLFVTSSRKMAMLGDSHGPHGDNQFCLYDCIPLGRPQGTRSLPAEDSSYGPFPLEAQETKKTSQSAWHMHRYARRFDNLAPHCRKILRWIAYWAEFRFFRAPFSNHGGLHIRRCEDYH